MKFLIAEEALRSLDGHWFEYLLAIADGCRRAGDDVTVACHRDAVPEVSGALDAQLVFVHSAWDRDYLDAGGGPLRRLGRILRHNFRLYRICARLLRLQGPFDCVFVPTILIDHLGAWTLLAWTGRQSYGKLLLFFVNSNGKYQGPGLPSIFPRTPNTILSRLLLRSLRPLVTVGKVVLGADGLLADEFSRFCGLPFESFPHPVEVADLPDLKAEDLRAKKAGVITLSCFGSARHEKGSDLLQAAIVRLRRERPDLGHVHFVIHWLNDFQGRDGRRYTRDPLLADPGVEYLSRSFTPHEYREQLARTDGMLLPYRAQSYYARASRVAIEAAMLGIPMLVTRGTWLDEMVQECGAGLTFENENVDELTTQLIRLIDEFPAWRIAAAQRAPLARRLHSAERFRECLLRGPAASPAPI